MDFTNSSQHLYSGDHASLQNTEYNTMEQTSTATDHGDPSQARGDEERQRENFEQNARTDVSDEVPQGYLLDENVENMPRQVYDSWMVVDEAFPGAQAVGSSADPVATRCAIADARLRAAWRAMRGPAGAGGSAMAVDGENTDFAGGVPEIEWEDIRVLDCSDELWDEILGDDAVDPSAIWGDGQTMGNVGAEEDMKS